MMIDISTGAFPAFVTLLCLQTKPMLKVVLIALSVNKLNQSQVWKLTSRKLELF